MTGNKMKAAVEFVRNNPGCTKLAPAEAVGPNGSRRYGYATVDRCIRAGLIVAERLNNRYALTVAS